jgi:hypothetical protein
VKYFARGLLCTRNSPRNISEALLIRVHTESILASFQSVSSCTHAHLLLLQTQRRFFALRLGRWSGEGYEVSRLEGWKGPPNNSRLISPACFGMQKCKSMKKYAYISGRDLSISVRAHLRLLAFTAPAAAQEGVSVRHASGTCRCAHSHAKVASRACTQIHTGTAIHSHPPIDQISQVQLY